MKILFIGSLAEGQTSRMRMEVLRELGHTIIPVDSQSGWDELSRISRRLQQKFCCGHPVKKVNDEILRLAQESKPDLLWGEKQEYIYPDTLVILSKMGVRLLHYTPDPYFYLSWKQTRLSDACMPLYDYAITSKRYELDNYHRECQRVVYMPLGFAEAVHRPVMPLDTDVRCRFTSDVSFLGGWEPRREALLDAIVRRTSHKLKIWGYGWDHLRDGKWTLRRWWAMRRNAGSEPVKIKKNGLLAEAVQGGEVYGEEYVWALSCARINIGFLRHVWPDQHTTRTFEIPACCSMMLADRTDEHREFFEEGVEAEFFSGEDELIDKLDFYLDNEQAREKIAINGFIKCHKAGYSYKNRLISVLKGLN